ncbi:DUF2278 family protein [Iocasia frigidifontis]|uniref:DUF2278 family protein n=1 Tax=Iocasia fonsfrigidae TaxID=2682810 RepID=A0A8A7K6P5_9FIRM|nr:DUF2278 family protein [Iocasia fonsfrigidae]QTL97386.1 DUF2278 family protein [Iocasia fonsfrigidae]
MSNSKYGVLIGRVEEIKADPARDKTPHYKINIWIRDDEIYKVLINCQSINDKTPQLLYYMGEVCQAEITGILQNMEYGFHEIDYANNINPKIAVDYIRSGLFDPHKMKVIPYDISGKYDLRGLIEKDMKKALNNDGINIYVFGIHYNNDDKGIHNIHMNQGNIEFYSDENRIYHDGCFFLHFTEEDKWFGYFLAFQNQSWCTDDGGNPLEGSYKEAYPTGECCYNTVKIKG